MRSCVIRQARATSLHSCRPAFASGRDAQPRPGRWPGPGTRGESEGALTWAKWGPPLNFLVASSEDSRPSLHLDFPECSVILGKRKGAHFHKHLTRCSYSRGAYNITGHILQTDEEAAISQKPAIPHVFMEWSPPGDQGGKGMRTGMSWFVVCVHVYVLVHKPALCTYQTLSRYQILFPFLFVYLTAPFGLPSSLPLFPCWTKIQKWNVYLAIWCWVEFYIPCSQNIL